MKIRKQVYDLTLEDITRYPVWQYVLDEEEIKGQDEATVRPVALPDLDLQRSSYMIRARFNLADGSRHIGLVTLSDLPDDGILKIEGDIDSNAKRQPVIITSRGQVWFWFGSMKPEHKEIVDAYRTLGKDTPNAVFPITYHSDVNLSCGPCCGRIGGFLYLEDKTSCLDCVVKELR